MLNSRRLPALLPRIIGALLLVFLGGCSAVKIGYNNAPALVYWWLDSYIDFNDAQTVQVRDSLATLQAWHRTNELPAYADLLRQIQRVASGPVTPQQVCAFSDQIRLRVQRLGEQAAEGMSRVVPTLEPQQWRHLALQFDKHNRTWREEWLDSTPAELSARRLKKAEERAQSFYGRLEEAQLAILRQSVSSPTFDARLAWRERLRRQQDMLQVLREHGNSDRAAHVKAEILALLQRNLNSPDAAYQTQFERLVVESCANIAALHNSTSAAQRRHLQDKLQDYEADARALISAK
ncbi:MAG: DUF6279 family lipoprotein [Hylemonella sp.]|nr:DUF6279 family lipoprotein [Hylemonella sp.]MDP1937211.1 DUF6279 family lipoprotein [Hylemonella sp.]